MKIHCPSCGEELEVPVKVSEVQVLQGFGRVYVKFVPPHVDHICKEEEPLDHSCSCHVNGNECGLCKDLKCPIQAKREKQ